jgi:hypothetical protein
MSRLAEDLLQDFVSDPGGAYPVIRDGARAEQRRLLDELVKTIPQPETAYARLCSAHERYLELEKLTTPEGFVRYFSPEGGE